MTISDKARKVLWGRSGNRCAICRRELVIDATASDDESVVGEECHIISGKEQGPRYQAEFPSDRLDEPDNLVLLCRVHHKMVDDQHDFYSVERLTKLKADHEHWVSTVLAGEPEYPPIRVVRVKENIPLLLTRLNSGQELMNVAGGAYQFGFEHIEPSSPDEAALLREFIQSTSDWGEMWNVIEPGERVTAAFELSQRIRGLEEAGLRVFGAREIRGLEGGKGAPQPWPIAWIAIRRTSEMQVDKTS